MIGIGLLLCLGASEANGQTQLTLGNSGQSLTFQATSASSMEIGIGSCSSTTFTGTCTLTGTAFFGAFSSTYTFTTTTGIGGAFTATNLGGTVFAINTPSGATSTFTYNDGTNSLSGSIQWTTLSNGSSQPHLNGIMTGFTVSGTAAFQNAFAGSAVFITLGTMPLNCSPSISPCTVENLFNNTGSVGTGAGASGSMSGSPEPAAILLFGSGLVVVGGFLRRRKQALINS